MPVDPAAVQRNVTELLAGIDAHPSRPIAEGLQALVESAVQLLDIDCVGVLLLDEQDRLRAVAASTAMAAELEQAQVRTGVGPGIDTVLTSRTVTVPDLRAADRYQGLVAELGPASGRAVVSAPVLVNGSAAGNLNAIRAGAHDWSAAEIDAIETYAELVATLLQLRASRVRITEDTYPGDRGRGVDGGTVEP